MPNNYLVVENFFIGNSNENINLDKKQDSLVIINDGTMDITVIVNDLTIVVKEGEVFDEILNPFINIDITTTSNYRIYTRNNPKNG